MMTARVLGLRAAVSRFRSGWKCSSVSTTLATPPWLSA